MIRLELELGCRTTGEAVTLRQRLTGVTMFPVDDSTWRSASDIGFHLRRQGLIVAVPDLLIATTAIQHGLVLVHYDSAFDKVADHTDLRVESYAKSTP